MIINSNTTSMHFEKPINLQLHLQSFIAHYNIIYYIDLSTSGLSLEML